MQRKMKMIPLSSEQAEKIAELVQNKKYRNATDFITQAIDFRLRWRDTDEAYYRLGKLVLSAQEGTMLGNLLKKAVSNNDR